MTRKQTLALAFKVLVSAGLIAWLFGTKVDFGAIQDRLLQVSLPMLAAGFAVFLVQLLIGGVRWKVVTDAVGARLPLGAAVRFFYIGAFFGQVLSVGGDAVRVYKAYRAGLGLARAFNGVFLERAGTILALLLIVAATQPVLLGRIEADMARTMLFAALLALAVGILGIAVLLQLDRLPVSLDRFRVVRGLRTVAGDTRRVFLAPGPLVRLLVWGVLTHLNLTFAVYVLARGLALGVTWLDCLALVPPVILVATLPVSIGGWGVREGAMIFLLGLIGVPENDAGALSILAGLVGIAAALPGGAIWLFGKDHHLGLDSMPGIPGRSPNPG
ncbi:MAG: flippase-like domain-containing protein [Rhodospirillales bacterium]|nr:flippase-like domain-containing protein [Rhodospirillales bacterium]